MNTEIQKDNVLVEGEGSAVLLKGKKEVKKEPNWLKDAIELSHLFAYL